jgi:hypothetical protein
MQNVTLCAIMRLPTVKTLPVNHSRSTEVREGTGHPPVGEVIWTDDGKPWFILTVENALSNAELSEYIRATGP